jgi:hypothetical protein
MMHQIFELTEAAHCFVGNGACEASVARRELMCSDRLIECEI